MQPRRSTVRRSARQPEPQSAAMPSCRPAGRLPCLIPAHTRLMPCKTKTSRTRPRLRTVCELSRPRLPEADTLFTKMGLDTQLFQASGDGGIDCMAYDPDPIKGGKIAVQAKLYNRTVPPTHVRDQGHSDHDLRLWARQLQVRCWQASQPHRWHRPPRPVPPVQHPCSHSQVGCPEWGQMVRMYEGVFHDWFLTPHRYPNSKLKCALSRKPVNTEHSARVIAGRDSSSCSLGHGVSSTDRIGRAPPVCVLSSAGAPSPRGHHRPARATGPPSRQPGATSQGTTPATATPHQANGPG